MCNSVTIHRAEIGDIDTIAPLFDAYRVFYEQKSDLSLAIRFLNKRLQQEESVIFYAKVDNAVVGFTQLYFTFSSVSAQKSIILNDLYVDPVHRSKRVGEALLIRAQLYCTELNAKGVALETSKDNPAQRLYEKLGWVKDGKYLHYFWKP